MLYTIIRGIRRRWIHRTQYSSNIFVLLALYDSVIRFLQKKFTCRFIPGCGKELRINLNDLSQSLVIRLGSSDWFVLEEVFIDKIYDSVLDYDSNANIVFDLGSNVGYSIVKWNDLWPNVRIVAIEPDSENMRMLKNNVSTLENVQFLQAGVSDYTGKGLLRDEGDECAYSLVGQNTQGEVTEINVVSMSNLLQKYSVEERVSLLKCDIEGAEKQVFSSCQEWINKICMLLVEVHHPYGIDDLLNDINRNGGKADILKRISNHVILIRNRAAY